MKRNLYAEMRKAQQEEFNSFPIGAAFSTEQFNKMMHNWGLDPETDTDKIVKLYGGTFILKDDVQAFKEMCKRHKDEMDKAIEEDADGSGFIKDMFLTELNNHEYGYTMDTEDTLDALGYTADDIINNPKLKKGIELAVTEIMRFENGE